jgi:sulfoxide reductase heme-binding subunit YedZ
MKTYKNKIGLILFSLYIFQYIALIEFEYLENLQRNSIYRHWSGLALFLLILYQWLLPIYRVVYDMKGKAIEKKTTVHNWVGVVSPLVFFLHSTKPDYGLLLILTVLFFLNLSFGLLSYTNSSNNQVKYYQFGIAVHILLSVSIMILTLLHIWIVFYYN